MLAGVTSASFPAMLFSRAHAAPGPAAGTIPEALPVHVRWRDSHSSPRIVVLQGMLRRGLQLEALREFIIGQGASKNVTYQVGHLCCCCTCVQGDLSALGN